VHLEAKSEPALAQAIGNRLRRSTWILLLLLGLFLWIPALLRAKVGASAGTESSTVDVRNPAADVQSLRVAEAPATMHAVSLAASRQAPPAIASRLVLTTTILGKTRRAAIVNGRLYREGDKIVAGSELYRLCGVAEDRIEVLALGRYPGAKHCVMLQSAAAQNPDPPGSH
jgi:hypothetical protein